MTSQSEGILVDDDIEALLGRAVRWSAEAPDPLPEQVQPASLDLRLGAEAHRLRAGFLPSATPIRERIAELSTQRLTLDEAGQVLERGTLWLVRLEEELALPAQLSGRLNPRSSAGRCDLFTRALAAGNPRFDEIPAGYRGELWLEVAPLSFSVRLRRGDRLCQLRLARGRAAIDASQLRRIWSETPLAYRGQRALEEHELALDESGALALAVGLRGRDPVGWRARRSAAVLEYSSEARHAREEFWEPVQARDGATVLEPERFTIFASRERLCIPPALAAEMIPVDVGIGELRNNYAGFFDPGFGWPAADSPNAPAHAVPIGTPAVLEVRAHDVPFLLEDGQVGFRLRFFRTLGRPRKLYGEGRRERSYADQDLTLARVFRQR